MLHITLPHVMLSTIASKAYQDIQAYTGGLPWCSDGPESGQPHFRLIVNHLRYRGRFSPAIIPVRLQIANMKDIMYSPASRQIELACQRANTLSDRKRANPFRFQFAVLSGSEDKSRFAPTAHDLSGLFRS